MPTFDTPDPISVIFEVGVGNISIVASERADTVVEVRPSDPVSAFSRAAADRTRVEYDSGKLLIQTPRGRRLQSGGSLLIQTLRGRRRILFGGGESVDVRVELPAGSRVHGEAEIADLECVGRLGECRYKARLGDLKIEEAGPVQLAMGSGDITIERELGHADVQTRSGGVRINAIDGTAAIKYLSGGIWIGEVTGDLRAEGTSGQIEVERARAAVDIESRSGGVRINAIDGTAAIKYLSGGIWIGEVTGDLRAEGTSGEIEVERAHAAVAARTSMGDIRVGEVRSGAVVLETFHGEIEIGIREGIPAWLDLDTVFGQVDSRLEAVEAPTSDEQAVKVRARTTSGDIRVYRSHEDKAEESEC